MPELLQELSARFPNVTLAYTYANENWSCNTGEYEFEGGEITCVNLPADQSERAREIAEELLGPPYSEEDDDEDDEDWEDEV